MTFTLPDARFEQPSMFQPLRPPMCRVVPNMQHGLARGLVGCWIPRPWNTQIQDVSEGFDVDLVSRGIENSVPGMAHANLEHFYRSDTIFMTEAGEPYFDKGVLYVPEATRDCSYFFRVSRDALGYDSSFDNFSCFYVATVERDPADLSSNQDILFNFVGANDQNSDNALFLNNSGGAGGEIQSFTSIGSARFDPGINVTDDAATKKPLLGLGFSHERYVSTDNHAIVAKNYQTGEWDFSRGDHSFSTGTRGYYSISDGEYMGHIGMPETEEKDYSGHVHAIFMWKRGLSDDEMKSLVHNPYQFLIPE